MQYKMMSSIPGFVRKFPGVVECDLSGIVVDANNHRQFSNGQEGTLPIHRSLCLLGRLELISNMLINLASDQSSGSANRLSRSEQVEARWLSTFLSE
jgi:hypothetical protein